MGVPGFSLDQLMELAGLSVATAVHDFYQKQQSTGRRRILILAGPGNNGGDGLVAARHLKHFGFDCYVVYPKKSAGQLFANLVQQCEDLNISVNSNLAGATAVATTATSITPSSICPDFGQFDMVTSFTLLTYDIYPLIMLLHSTRWWMPSLASHSRDHHVNPLQP